MHYTLGYTTLEQLIDLLPGLVLVHENSVIVVANAMKSIIEDSCSRRIVGTVSSAIALLEEECGPATGTLSDTLHKYRNVLAESFGTTLEEDAAYDKSLRLQQERRLCLLKEEAQFKYEIESHRMRQAQIESNVQNELYRLKDEFTSDRGNDKEVGSCQDDKMKETQIQHQQEAERLLSTKEELQNRLESLQKQHVIEVDALQSTKEDVENLLLEEKNIHVANMTKLAEESNMLASIMRRESEQKKQLTLHFDLVDQNLREEEEEEKMVRGVLDKERQAEELLNHGAKQIQRLVRGMQEREALAKRKAKGSKGKTVGRTNKKNKKRTNKAKKR